MSFNSLVSRISNFGPTGTTILFPPLAKINFPSGVRIGLADDSTPPGNRSL